MICMEYILVQLNGPVPMLLFFFLGYEVPVWHAFFFPILQSRLMFVLNIVVTQDIQWDGGG